MSDPCPFCGSCRTGVIPEDAEKLALRRELAAALAQNARLRKAVELAAEGFERTERLLPGCEAGELAARLRRVVG